jgi:sterol desaturase/sphingolipid hydroxylase (fatty acid hydroxylase superfamily)
MIKNTKAWFLIFFRKMEMMETTVNTKGKLFNNRFLEALTKTSFTITFVFYPLIVLSLILVNFFYTDISFRLSIILFILGLFSWTLFEYLMHRYLFHFISEKKWIQKFHYVIHGIHHDYPHDEERLFMPPVPGVLIAGVLLGVLFLIMRDAAFVFEAGMLSGYLIYVYIHYMVHAKRPVRRFRFLWTHHAKHHYAHPDKAYGVSSPIWDYVFGTMPPKK